MYTRTRLCHLQRLDEEIRVVFRAVRVAADLLPFEDVLHDADAIREAERRPQEPRLLVPQLMRDRQAVQRHERPHEDVQSGDFRDDRRRVRRVRNRQHRRDG